MVIEINDKSIKGRIKEAKTKVETGVKKTVTWCKENPERAIALVVGVVTLVDICSKGAMSIGRSAERIHNIRIENRRIWDPVNGMYHYTKRPLTTSQKLEFERLVKKGYPRGQVLDAMGVLKK